MDICGFCSGKAVPAEYCGDGIKSLGMMVEMFIGRKDTERDYAYNGVMLKAGNKLCFDNSSAEYTELSIDIKYCPFCGRELKPEE